jgi:acyl-CoA hydrolase
MDQYKLVLPEHLNHYGHLFGGNMLKWADEYSWIAASLDYPSARFVTIGMDKVEFRKGVHKGTILRFHIERTHEGRTSVRYQVQVYAENVDNGQEELVFNTQVGFVNVNENGEKMRLEDPS